MIRFHKNLFIVSILIMSFIFTGIVTENGFAQEVGSDKEKLSQLKNTIKKVQTQLVQNKEKEKNITLQMSTLNKKISQAEEELGEISKEVSITQEKVNNTKKELLKAEQNIDNKNNTINSRLRAIYKNGTVGYVEVLLNSESIVDLFSKLDMVKKIINHDVGLLKEMKGQRDLINTKKKTLEHHESNLVAMMSKMTVKQKELQQSRGEMSRIKEKLQQDNTVLEEQIDKLNQYAQQIAEQIRRKQSTGKYEGGKLAWPAPGYTRITSPFGYRPHPILKRKKLHTGIDIGVPSGNSIVAAGNGTVLYAGWLGGYGKAVMIDHGGGIVTLYAHNSSLLVQEGARVTRGKVIAKSGSTGMSTGPHLHFEVRKNGDYVDPIPWVK